MFMSLLEKRRSIRKYRPMPVEPEKIDRLVAAALRAPSSRGFNPWQFIVVTDPTALAGLSKAKPHGAGFLANAPLGIVVCGDPKISDVWVEDTAIASLIIHLAAESLGLGSCWIQIRKRKDDANTSAQARVREILDIPADLEVESIVAIGYPAQSRPPHGPDTLQYEKVHLDGYGKSYRSADKQ